MILAQWISVLSRHFVKSDAPAGAYWIVRLIFLGLRAALRRFTPGY
jgi:hypothetical protein